MWEGGELTKAVIQLLGEDILMYASDYPHGESWFPKSVDTVLAWDLPERQKRKLFWDDALRVSRRCTPAPGVPTPTRARSRRPGTPGPTGPALCPRRPRARARWRP